LKFLFRKTSASKFSGFNEFLSFETVNPAVEKRRSLAVEVAEHKEETLLLLPIKEILMHSFSTFPKHHHHEI
jgi:hypothetical protein